MAYKQTLSYGGPPSTPKPKPGILPEVSAMSDYEKRNYDLCDLILDAGAAVEHLTANIGVPRDCQFNQSDPPQGGLEMDLSNTIRSGPRGVSQFGAVYAPLRIYGSGLDTKTDAAGGGTVSQNIGNPIDALTAQMPNLGNYLLDSPTILSYYFVHGEQDHERTQEPARGHRLLLESRQLHCILGRSALA